MALGDPSSAADAPKYSLVELERRWRVRSDARPELQSSSFDGAAPIKISDRYLKGTRFRLRRMHFPDGRAEFKLAKKYDAADAAARPMVNAYLTQAEYDAFAAIPAFRVYKCRYYFDHGEQQFGLDIFEGNLAGLEILECETAHRKALDAVIPPEWVGVEVTYLPQWQGGSLAQHQKIPEE